MQSTTVVQDTLLATAFKGRVARDISSLETNDAIRAIATEIDRTILPCRLCAQFGNGTSIFFLARNRRLHGLKYNDGQNLPAKFNDGNLSADMAMDLVQWIGALCNAEGLIRITRDSIRTEDDMSSLGISPARLSLASGLDLPPDERPDLTARLQELIDAHPSQIRAAFLMAKDEVSAVHGSPDSIDQQTDVTLEILGLVTADDTPFARLLETDGVLVLPHPQDSDDCMIVGGSLGLISLAVVSSTTILDAFHWWQSGQRSAT